jgi:acyl carrier protein
VNLMKNSEEDLEQAVAAIHAFIVRQRGPLPGPLTPDTELLRRGLLESLQIVQLTRELANTFGVKLPPGALLLQDFETPRSIWKCFERLK